MTDVILLPCMRPGCFGTPAVDKWDAGSYGNGWEYAVTCETCGLSSPRRETKGEAIENWNNREELDIPTGTWYFVHSRNSPLVPDQVLKSDGRDGVKVDDRSSVPAEVMMTWGYTLIPVRLTPLASGYKLLWSDDRIKSITYALQNIVESERVFERMKAMRDEYELERKNKIFIPSELRGCLLSTIQKSRNFLAEMITTIVTKLEKYETLLPAVQEEIDGWKAELAEYDMILKAIMEKKDGEEKISE